MSPRTIRHPAIDSLPPAAGGEMAERIRARDWSATPLGPRERWPAALENAVSLSLASKFPMFVWWGEERIALYNDAFAPLLGRKHPTHLGARAHEDLAEIWDVVGPIADRVLQQGRAIGGANLPLLMNRSGYAEETYFVYSFSPIAGDGGGVGGLFCACQETTAEVLRLRRLELLRGLGAEPPGDRETVEQAAARALDALDRRCPDVPFALLYLADGADASLAACAGVAPGAALAPPRLSPADGPWPLAGLDRPRRVDGLRSLADPGAEEDPHAVDAACVFPLSLAAGAPPIAHLVLGINPLRAFDEEYESFFHLVARHVAACIAGAKNREVERERIFRRAEETLRESEALFRDMANSVPLLIWMADETGRMRWFNRRAYEFTGATGRELEGEGWLAFHHPDHVEGVVRKLSRAVATGEAWEDTFPLRGRDGAWRWFLSRALPLRDAEGRIVRWFGSNTDVTDELHAREELAAALAARDEFLSIASHELKTPLASLRLQAQMMKRGMDKGDERFFEPARVARLVDQAERQTVRLTRLIDDMLDISRIRTGKLAIRPEPVALDELVREVVERMRPELAAAGVPVELECGVRIEGNWDRLRIEQVLTNLLTNARRYGERRPVTVHLVRRESVARISVRDRGLGVPHESRERIFERFERGGPDEAMAGLGLGLYISRQIVEAHGGRIWVESDGPGAGSTFRFELPLEGGEA